MHFMILTTNWCDSIVLVVRGTECGGTQWFTYILCNKTFGVTIDPDDVCKALGGDACRDSHLCKILGGDEIRESAY